MSERYERELGTCMNCGEEIEPPELRLVSAYCRPCRTGAVELSG